MQLELVSLARRFTFGGYKSSSIALLGKPFAKRARAWQPARAMAGTSSAD
jgi:hypothetical protein